MFAEVVGVGIVGSGFVAAVAHPIIAMAWISCCRRSFAGVC